MEININDTEIEQLVQYFKILGETARWQILSAICHSERSVQEICSRTNLSQSNVSKHLRMMKDAGVHTLASFI